MDILQRFDYRSSGYHRPNQAWVCGWAAEGKPCQIGPDGRGNCRATFECQPSKTDDRWQCNRSELVGGKCPDGPLPDGTCCRSIQRCRPVRSWRARVRVTRNWVLAVSVGLLLLAVAGPLAPVLLNPGDVTFQHSEVADCGGCHTAFEKGAAAWPMAAFAHSAKVTDSQTCIACHDLGENSLNPHGLQTTTLNLSTVKAMPRRTVSEPLVLTAASWARDLPLHDDSKLACATCHQEHNGKAFQLTAMSNKRCVACHKEKFTSLAQGHPEFAGFPFDRRTRINFDHGSHLGKHFRDANVKAQAPKECSSCHIAGQVGSLMVVKEFESTCAACHEGQIEGVGRATSKGVEILAVPGFDVQVLGDSNISIGSWPEDAEGEITPFMDLLLAGNADYTTARANLSELDLLDLADASGTQLADVEQLAWGIKELYFDLATMGVATLSSRLASAFGHELDTMELARLTNLLPADAVEAAMDLWFPTLHDDVIQFRAGKSVPIPSSESTNAIVSTVATVETSTDDEIGDDEIGDDEIGDDEIGDDEIGDDEIGDDEIGDDEIGDDEIGDDDGAEDGEEGEETQIANLASEDWPSAGGWYREDFSLRYRPAGHADVFVRSWLDIAAQAGTMPAKEPATDLFETLASTKSPGACSKCHSVDEIGEGIQHVNWQGKRPVTNQQTFTAFSHVGHFTLLDERGCLTCHSLNSEVGFSDGFKDRDPTTFVSNFNPVERATCAACHTPAEAGDNCVTCHNYHIGTFPPAQTSTPKMMEQAKN